MTPQLHTNCILCSEQTSNHHFKLQSELLENWQQNCLSSFCETLQLDPCCLQRTDFCSSCQQILRDMDFLVKSISKFQLKLKVLKTRAMAIIITNANQYQNETNLYARTVRNVVKSLMGENSASFESVQIGNLKECTDMDAYNIIPSQAPIPDGRFPKRTRVSRFSKMDDEYSLASEIEIKDETNMDIDIEEHETWNNNSDPDFTVDYESEDSINTPAVDPLGESKPRSKRKTHNRKSLLKRRSLKLNGPDTHKCDKCDLTFDKRRHLAAHCESLHGVQPVLFPCSSCERSFRSKAGLKIHDCLALMATESLAIANPKCSICFQPFASEEELLTHAELHNKLKDTATPFACVICHIDCTSIVKLQEHVRIHDECFIRCSEEGCKEEFSSKLKLQRHTKRKHKPQSIKSTSGKNDGSKPKYRQRRPLKNVRYSCSIPNCPAFYFSPNLLQFHVAKVHEKDPQPHHCDKCERKFEKRAELVFHAESVHGLQPVLFSCANCERTFRSRAGRKDHTCLGKTATEKATTSLNTDNETSSSRGNSKFLSGRLFCQFPNCKAFYLKQSSLRLHIARDHDSDPEPYRCTETECELKFQKRADLTAHAETVHGILPELFPCTKCERSFRSKEGRKLHFTIAHPPTQGLPKCSICLRPFPNEADLQVHVNLHNNLRMTGSPFACVLCNAECVNSRELQTHVRQTHDETVLKCPEDGCIQVFTTKQGLQTHLRRRHRLAPKAHLCCPKCKYQAQSPAALRRHMWKHTENRTFVCDREGCGRSFKFESTLRRHFTYDHLDQTVAEVFKCTLCFKEFKKREALNMHQALHTSKRPYLCEKCPLSFKSPDNLRCHKKVHLEETKGQRILALQKPRRSRLLPTLPLEDDDSVQPGGFEIGGVSQIQDATTADAEGEQLSTNYLRFETEGDSFIF